MIVNGRAQRQLARASVLRIGRWYLMIATDTTMENVETIVYGGIK